MDIRDKSTTADKVMNRNFAVIQSGHSILDANKIFLDKALTFAPVITPMGDFLGLLTEQNLVKMNIEYQKDEKKNRVAHYEDLLVEFYSINYQDTIDDLFKAIFSTEIYYVVVLNDGNKMVGTIDAKNLLSMISGEKLQVTDLRQKVILAEEDAKKLVAEAKELGDQLRFYNELFDNAPLPMHSVDENSIIIAANKKLHQILDYAPGSLIGASFSDIYPKSNQKLAEAGLKLIMKTGEHERITTSMVRSDGELVNVHLISSSMYKDEDFVGTVTIAIPTDII